MAGGTYATFLGSNLKMAHNFSYNHGYFHFGKDDGPSMTPWPLPPQSHYQYPREIETPEPSPTSDTSEPTLVSASVKIICPNEKLREYKVFMLRDINTDEITTVESLRDEIHSQFGATFVDKETEFGVGYFQGTKRIWIRNNEDLKALMQLLQTKSVTLWCNGSTKVMKKRKKASESSGSEEETPNHRKKKKSEKTGWMILWMS